MDPLPTLGDSMSGELERFFALKAIEVTLAQAQEVLIESGLREELIGVNQTLDVLIEVLHQKLASTTNNFSFEDYIAKFAGSSLVKPGSKNADVVAVDFKNKTVIKDEPTDEPD